MNPDFDARERFDTVLAAETTVCNLGSVNLAEHVAGGGSAGEASPDTDPGLDRDRLADTVETAMRMLDDVVDLNFYRPIERERSLQRRARDAA